MGCPTLPLQGGGGPSLCPPKGEGCALLAEGAGD